MEKLKSKILYLEDEAYTLSQNVFMNPFVSSNIYSAEYLLQLLIHESWE